MKNFKLNIVLRTLIILGLSLLFSWVLTNRHWFFTPLVIGIILISVVWNLIYYVQKTSRNLSLFLLNIKQGGFMSSFKEKNDPNQGLYKVFDDVIHEFQHVTMEKEAHYLYLQTLNENIGVGLLSFDENGKIDLYNPSAKGLLKKPNLQRIDQLKEIDQSFEKLSALESGQRQIIKAVIDGELLELSVISKKFRVKEQLFTLLIFQNINAELEQKEVEAWQKLISVLTHEIMNSVTPISSLSGALNQQLGGIDLSTLDEEDQDDIKKSLSTIESRSKGLMTFVNAYKEFTKSPDLNYSEFSLHEVFNDQLLLLKEDLKNNNIKVDISVEPTFICRADRDLLDQVIINLLKNAIQSLNHESNGMIKISARKNVQRNSIEISDNGPGIPPEMLDKIFVPFFTTKKKGTGVGLSFARKVMRLHNGQIKVYSKQGEGTTFNLIW